MVLSGKSVLSSVHRKSRPEELRAHFFLKACSHVLANKTRPGGTPTLFCVGICVFGLRTPMPVPPACNIFQCVHPITGSLRAIREVIRVNIVSKVSQFRLPSPHARRSGKVVLTAEPNNLTNVNSFKYSGLANSKAVGIQFAQDAKGRPCASMSMKVCTQKRASPAACDCLFLVASDIVSTIWRLVHPQDRT